MKIHPDYADFIASLNHRKVEFVIVGAFDLAHLGHPRYTGDLDIWVRPTAANARALLGALSDFGLGSLDLTEQDILSSEIVQLGYPPVRIDLLTALEGVTANEVWAGREAGPFGGQTVFYLGKKVFVKNKLATGRPKDLVDVKALEKKKP